MAKATFAAGCFWGVEAAFQDLPGVLSTRVGYTGGHVLHPTYEQVCTDTTGHAEALEIDYDPSRIGYGDLLEVFWTCHDPTTLNRQGPDIGRQYRSAIFYHTDQQRAMAEAAKTQAAQRFLKSIVTEVTAASVFYPAEDYHQQYFKKRGISHCGL